MTIFYDSAFMTLHSLDEVFSQVLKTDQIAVSFFDAGSNKISRYTGNEFLALAHEWRIRVEALPEAIIPIFGRMTIQMMAAFWGCLWAGKIPTFLSHPSLKIRPEEFTKKLNNYQSYFGSNIVICEPADRNVFGNDSPSRTLLPTESRSGSHALREYPTRTTIAADAPLFLQCSSGTTGAQKVVAITEKQLLNQLNSYRSTLAIGPKDAIISWLPLYHDMGLIAAFLLPLSTGIPALYIDPFEWIANPDILLRLIESEKSTLCWLPNFAFSLLAKLRGNYDLSTMKAFISCSEPATEKALKAFQATHKISPGQAAVCYALAENVFAATQTDIGVAPMVINLDTPAYQSNRVKISEAPGTVLVSCGKTIPGVEVRVSANIGEEIGEILIRGDSAISGYYKQESFLESGWLPTGDIGFFHKNELFICGRKKDLIISNGKNIYPHEVESVVNKDPRVYAGRCVVLGLPDENDSEEVLILVETASILPESAKDALCSDIKREIDGIFDISSLVNIVPYKWLLKTSSGKLARSANLEKYLSAKKQNFHVVGDSHVRLLWTADRSFINARRNVHAHWWGVVWSGNWQDFKEHVLKVITQLAPYDVLILESGEPECRVIFPSDDNPHTRIAQAISDYRAYITWIREHWQGTLAFMSGPPTNGVIIGKAKGDLTTGEVVGTPEKRYQYQAIFYKAMKELCAEFEIEFLDMVSPWLQSEPYLSTELMTDYCHLKQFCNQLHFEVLENVFGFVDRRAGEGINSSIVWNGEYDSFESLFNEFIVELRGGNRSIDFKSLVSSGAIDSRKFISIISWLEKSLKVEVDLLAIRPHFFESAEAVFSNIIRKPSSNYSSGKNI